jgi:hypothetical protein
VEEGDGVDDEEVDAEDSLVVLLSFVSELEDLVSSEPLPLVLVEPFLP